MDRFVVVCLIKGEALEFHEDLVQKVCNNFNVKRQRLPGHFTIKAPFETDKIADIESLTSNFSKKHNKTKIVIENYGHFRDSVVYMDVIPTTEAISTHDEYIDELKSIKWLEWKRNEGKGRVFHCTIVSKLPEGKFQDIWNFVIKKPCKFNLYFDNISILKWDKDRWVVHKEYDLI